MIGGMAYSHVDMQRIYYGGTIITMDNNSTVDAVLTENGYIRKTGDLVQLKAEAPAAHLIDLDGAVMLPGFLDAHSHFSAVANSMLQADLNETISLEEIEERLKNYADINHIEPGQWVMASGFDHNDLEGGMPDSQFLDRIFPDNPAIMTHKSGHMAVLNSMALYKLGITVDTESPEGGQIGVTEGKLNGLLEENAYMQYATQLPTPDINDMIGAYTKAQELYASYGITSVQEGMMKELMIPMYQALLNKDILKLDITGYAGTDSYDELCNIFPDSVNRFDRHFRIGGIKIFLDGSPQGRTAWMRTAYKGTEDYYGYGTMNDIDVKKAVRMAFDNNAQILAHCNGDRAAKQYIDEIAELEKEGVDISSIRPVMIHAQLLDIDQLKAVKKTGIIPSFFVAHVHYWGDVHIANFGLERASRISPLASALKENIVYTLHQDSPVIMPDMLQTISCAVNRITKNGHRLGSEEEIPVYEALKAVTSNVAYQYFEENEKGKIAQGMAADFVILDANPITSSFDDISKISVLRTIKSDEVIFHKS